MKSTSQETTRRRGGGKTIFPIIIHDSRASQKAWTHEVKMFPRIWKMRLRVARVRTPTASSRPILGDPTFAFLRCGLGTSLGSTSSCSFHIFYDATKELLLRPQFILGTVSQKSSHFWSIFESSKGRKINFCTLSLPKLWNDNWIGVPHSNTLLS